MLDVPSLGHGDDTAIITDIKNTVLLKDRAKHVVDNDRWSRVRYETRLFVKLLSEEVDSKVTVLARLSRRGDPDDLAWTTLEDQKISNADVVAWDGDGIGSPSTLDKANTLTNPTADSARTALLVLNDYLLTVMTVMMGMEWMEDTVGSLFQPLAERVIVTVVVVITHFGSRWWINGCFSFYFDFLLRSSGAAFGFYPKLFNRCCGSTLVFDVVGWLDASAVLAFSNVNFLSSTRSFYVKVVLSVPLLTGCFSSTRNFDVEAGLSVALFTGCFTSTRNFDVNLGLSVTLIGFAVASMK